MSSKTKSGLKAIFILIFFFFAVTIVVALYTEKLLTSDASGLDSVSASDDVIAVVEVNGPIMTAKETIELLHKSEEKKEVKAIIVRVNSPGGAVAPTQEIYNEILRIDKTKPVYASFSSIAASGGYYLALAARRIYANPGTITGSIGVIMEFMDLSKLFKFAMVSPQTLKSGRYKDTGTPSRPMRKDEKALYTKMVKEVYSQFTSAVVKRRGKRLKRPIEEIAQGQVFNGLKAVEIGLVDKPLGLWEAAREIHKELKFKGDLNMKYVVIKKDKGIMKFIDSLNSITTNLSKILTQSQDGVSIRY